METETNGKEQKVQEIQPGKVHEQSKVEAKPLGTHERILMAQLNGPREFSLLR